MSGRAVSRNGRPCWRSGYRVTGSPSGPDEDGPQSTEHAGPGQREPVRDDRARQLPRGVRKACSEATVPPKSGPRRKSSPQCTSLPPPSAYQGPETLQPNSSLMIRVLGLFFLAKVTAVVYLEEMKRRCFIKTSSFSAASLSILGTGAALAAHSSIYSQVYPWTKYSFEIIVA